MRSRDLLSLRAQTLRCARLTSLIPGKVVSPSDGPLRTTTAA
jgi:hypothetical protein